jgi:hypothetical protein
MLEYYQVIGAKDNLDEFFVFGIVALYHNIKGILINHRSNCLGGHHQQLKKKLNQHRLHDGMHSSVTMQLAVL